MKNIFTQIIKAYQEQQANIVCGALIMNGSSSVYQVYRALSR